MAIQRKTSRTKPAATISKTTDVSAAPVKIALLGFGTVGSSVARVLASSKLSDIELTHIFNRDVERKRASDEAKCVPASVVWTENFDEILNSGAEIVVELVGGLDPTEGWLRKCFAAGKSVVTANKQLIAYRGAALSRLAARHGVQLVHGAAVAGGVPVIPGILQGLGGDQITRISGIVNGTCNYILSHMETGAEYSAVLADAQGLGYAEANPSADVDGFDARAKLCILSRVALHAELNPDAVATQTISTVEAVDFAYAKELGCTIRQVSRAQLDGGYLRQVRWRRGLLRSRRGRRAYGCCRGLGHSGDCTPLGRGRAACAPASGYGRVPCAALPALCGERQAGNRLWHRGRTGQG
ncbi:MAG: homoserine dehydrogenase, partial [Acidobacteriaceae bacterium]